VKRASKGGRMTRPKAVVLSKSAVVPPRNLINPPPNRFTHEVLRSQPYFYEWAKGATPDGELSDGTKVTLMVHKGGDRCRVVTGDGLYVDTEYAGLRPL
jgi:hypothetical protein